MRFKGNTIFLYKQRKNGFFSKKILFSLIFLYLILKNGLDFSSGGRFSCFYPDKKTIGGYFS